MSAFCRFYNLSGNSTFTIIESKKLLQKLRKEIINLNLESSFGI